MNNDAKIQEMMLFIEDCIKLNKLDYLAQILCSLKQEYQEVCELSTDGEYDSSWTHQAVLNYLTYEPKL